MSEIVILGLAGAAGTISRYAVSGWALGLLGERFPYGTLVVNVIGCFLLGVATELGMSTVTLSDTAKTALTVGFLGAFTTYSTFGFETIKAFEDGDWHLALANIGANLVVGLAAVCGGLALGRQLWGAAA